MDALSTTLDGHEEEGVAAPPLQRRQVGQALQQEVVGLRTADAAQADARQLQPQPQRVAVPPQVVEAAG